MISYSIALSGWGRYPKANCVVSKPRHLRELEALMSFPVIARGLGRSYGDSSLQPHQTIDMTAFDHMLSFDESSGLLEVEAGVTLKEVLETFVPRGWFPPVTPGTQYVTIGGMIATDVHGKNHHVAGSFGQHLVSIDVLVNGGTIITCNKETNADLFHATIGGMGLTGIILRASFHLIRVTSAYIHKETMVTSNLDETMNQFEASATWPYTVAWIDCLATGQDLGRSIFYRGEHAKIESLSANLRSTPLKVGKKSKLSIPVNFPQFVLNRWSVKMFNAFYYWRGRKSSGAGIVDYDSFFYPLDSIIGWNRMYGRKGFLQYQCVFPKVSSREGLIKVLNLVAEAGTGSFLTVLKLFGKQAGVLSFPMEGYTLAMDFPLSEKNLQLLESLDKLVAEYGGRLYLAKDARMPARFFKETYANVGLFNAARSTYRTSDKFTSLQSERLGL